MGLTISDDLLQAAQMSEGEMRQELAIMLFARERLTLAQAARLAGVDRLAFQRVLAEREIPVHYSVTDFEHDLQTLNDLERS